MLLLFFSFSSFFSFSAPLLSLRIRYSTSGAYEIFTGELSFLFPPFPPSPPLPPPSASFFPPLTHLILLFLRGYTFPSPSPPSLSSLFFSSFPFSPPLFPPICSCLDRARSFARNWVNKIVLASARSFPFFPPLFPFFFLLLSRSPPPLYKERMFRTEEPPLFFPLFFFILSSFFPTPFSLLPGKQ